MHPTAPTTVHRLASDQVLRLQAPLELVGHTGTLWITVDGELEDIVLEPGEVRRIDGRAALLVCALGGEATIQAQPLARLRRHRLVPRIGERLSAVARAWTAPRALGARP